MKPKATRQNGTFQQHNKKAPQMRGFLLIMRLAKCN